MSLLVSARPALIPDGEPEFGPNPSGMLGVLQKVVPEAEPLRPLVLLKPRHERDAGGVSRGSLQPDGLIG